LFGAIPYEAAVRAPNNREIEELGDLVLESAAVTAAAPAPTGTVYPGGWLAENWHEQLFRGDVTLALLYYPRLLVHDPVADFFFSDFGSLPAARDLRERNGRMTVSAGPAMWAQAGVVRRHAQQPGGRPRLPREGHQLHEGMSDRAEHGSLGDAQ
jgi:hypothetical protein